MDISQRNTSRLLKKLEDAGIAVVVGKKMTGNLGRPSDIYEIKI
jgi:predicted ArsR family transcriptional regulator